MYSRARANILATVRGPLRGDAGALGALGSTFCLTLAIHAMAMARAFSKSISGHVPNVTLRVCTGGPFKSAWARSVTRGGCVRPA